MRRKRARQSDGHTGSARSTPICDMARDPWGYRRGSGRRRVTGTGGAESQKQESTWCSGAKSMTGYASNESKGARPGGLQRGM